MCLFILSLSWFRVACGCLLILCWVMITYCCWLVLEFAMFDVVWRFSGCYLWLCLVLRWEDCLYCCRCLLIMFVFIILIVLLDRLFLYVFFCCVFVICVYLFVCALFCFCFWLLFTFVPVLRVYLMYSTWWVVDWIGLFFVFMDLC